MGRPLLPYLKADLGQKIVILSGPRQSGKMTLARMLEVKWSDDQPSAHLSHYLRILSGARGVQLVAELKREKTFPSGVGAYRTNSAYAASIFWTVVSPWWIQTR